MFNREKRRTMATRRVPSGPHHEDSEAGARTNTRWFPPDRARNDAQLVSPRVRNAGAVSFSNR